MYLARHYVQNTSVSCKANEGMHRMFEMLVLRFGSCALWLTVSITPLLLGHIGSLSCNLIDHMGDVLVIESHMAVTSPPVFPSCWASAKYV